MFAARELSNITSRRLGLPDETLHLGDWWYVVGPAFDMERFHRLSIGLPYKDAYTKLVHIYLAWLIYDEGAPKESIYSTNVLSSTSSLWRATHIVKTGRYFVLAKQLVTRVFVDREFPDRRRIEEMDKRLTEDAAVLASDSLYLALIVHVCLTCAEGRLMAMSYLRMIEKNLWTWKGFPILPRAKVWVS